MWTTPNAKLCPAKKPPSLMAKPKKFSGRYVVSNFVIKEAFPPESPLAIDLLRLMAAYNDIREVIDWMGEHQSAPTKPIARKKWRVRAGIQHRFLFALMHEAFQILDQLHSLEEFREVEKLLEPEGKESLQHLRKAQRGGKQSIRARLTMGRNKVTFHYDRDDFRDGLIKLFRVDAEKTEAEVLFQGTSRVYYMLSEDVRDIIVYEFESQVDGEIVEKVLGEFLGEVTRLQKELVNFLEELFIAYMKSRGIKHCFQTKVIHE